MRCTHVRRILAVSPCEWTATQRQQVEEHTRACADCAQLACDFAAQERLLSVLPHAGMSPARQRAVLAQTQREAAWLRLRVRLSNALGAAAGILTLAFLITAIITLLPTPPPGSAAPPTGTPTLPTLPTPTATLAVAAPAPTGPLILVDNGPRSGPPLPMENSRVNFYMLLREGDYQVRDRLSGQKRFFEPGASEAPPLTAVDLAGVDLLVIPWVSCYAGGGSVDGETVVFDFNLTPGETAVIHDWVTDGGQALFVLDPVHSCHFEALETFGIHADVAQAIDWHDDLLHAGEGHLPDPSTGSGGAGRRFALAAQYRLQPLYAPEGESWARFCVQSGEHDGLVVQMIGAGRVAVLGAPSMVDGMRTVSDETEQGQPPPLFAADNLAFLTAVVEELTGAPSGLDVESIVWEERAESLREGADRLAERLDLWTPERVAWATRDDEGQAQAVALRVEALQARLDQALATLDELDDCPDPERYNAIRAALAEVLDGLNALEEEYGQQARESWEERQTRTLQPWLLGGLAVLAGIAAWGLRRLDVGPAELGRAVLASAPYAIAALLLLAHLLAAADMVGFGLRAGGYPLNRWGVWGYAALAALAALAFLRPRFVARDGLARLGLPLLVALALMQAHFLTDLVGAEYATWGDYEQPVVLAANLGVALALCLAGLLYRRPRWLRGMASVHAALVLGMMGGSSLLYALRDGFAPWQVYQVVLPPSPLPYLLIIYALGLLAGRPARNQVYWGALAVLLGVFLAGGTWLFVHDLTWMHSSRPPFFDWLTNLMLVPLLLALGVLSGAYLWRRRRLALRSPLAATLLLLWVVALLSPWLLGPGGLPQSGAAMPWVSADYRVPTGAWTWLLPVARVLVGAAPWLTLLVVALQIGQWMSDARRPLGPLLDGTRRRLAWLAVGYGVLLVTAVGLEMWSVVLRDVPLAMVWDSRQPVVVWGLVSLASVALFTIALCCRSGPGRWAGWLYGLVLTVQLPAWLHGLARLEPVFGLFNVLALIRDLSAPSVWSLILPWLSTLALGALVWHLSTAARALRQLGGREPEVVG